MNESDLQEKPGKLHGSKTHRLQSPNHRPKSAYPRFAFKPSYTAKMTAELGADLATVIPQPLYMPLIPCCFHNAFPVSQKVSRLVLPLPVISTGLTFSVCIRDLMVSAGKKTKLYDTPAVAPARSCCQMGRDRPSIECGACRSILLLFQCLNALLTPS